MVDGSPRAMMVVVVVVVVVAFGSATTITSLVALEMAPPSYRYWQGIHLREEMHVLQYS